MSQFLFYGCEMSRLLQDHHSVQSRSDRSAVCRLFHSPLPAYRRKSSPHRRMLIQEETALVLTRRGGGEWTELDGFQVTLPWSRYNNEKMESRNKKSCNIRCLYTEYAQRNAWRWDTTNTQFINSLLINLGCFLVKIILHVCHPVCSFCFLKILRCRWSDKWQLSAQDLLKRCW